MLTGSEPANDAGQPAVAPASGAPDDGTLSSLLAEARTLAREGRTLAEAELAYQTSRARVAAAGAGKAAAFATAAVVILVFAVFALIIGLLLSLATLVGPLAATGIAVGVLALVSFGCALLALKRWRRTMATVIPKDDAA